MTGATTVATYKVNALGQRVEKVAGGVTTRFVYDEQGHLLGEYDGAGALLQETVWLEDLPIATLRPTGATGTPTPIGVYYVHADHLGSPRAVTRPADNAMMWRWDNVDPFGANAANENPAGQGTFRYGLRFPGQYFDAETGSHYNYFRDYDPGVGRYAQSDPIGLKGSVNSYGYVGNNPLRLVDAQGLDAAPPDVPVRPPPPPPGPPDDDNGGAGGQSGCRLFTEILVELFGPPLPVPRDGHKFWWYCIWRCVSPSCPPKITFPQQLYLGGLMGCPSQPPSRRN